MRPFTSVFEQVSVAPLTVIAAFSVVCGMGVPVRAQVLNLSDGATVASVVYDKADGVPIAKAAKLLAHDLTSLTGIGPVVTADPGNVKGTGIMIGLATSPHMAALLKANGISTDRFEIAFTGALLAAACGGSIDQPPAGSTPSTTTATIDLVTTQQVVRGFGGASILPWRPDMTADEVNKAFGSGAGQLGLTILRIRVPGSQDEFAAQVPTARLAHSLGATIIATPWSPPASMKTNANVIGGEFSPDSYQAYAAHLKAFADYMLSNGAPLYAISVQNEPDMTVDYESCHWNAAQMLAFVKNNAPAVGISVFADESATLKRNITDAILSDAAATANLAFVAGHIYGVSPSAYPLAASKGKEVWMTEHLDLDATWNGALATGKEINDCLSSNMSAYV